MKAVTRGDGVLGDDVTVNVRTIRSIPLILRGNNYPDHFEIRGEIVMPFQVFEDLNRQREEQGESIFANPRNAAAGTLKIQDPSIVESRKLDAYFYALMGSNLPADNHYDNMQIARGWGFKISDAMERCSNPEDIFSYLKRWDIERHYLPVATDGVVIKLNNLALQEELGFTAKSPRWAIAYKFKTENVATILESVTYQVGRTGVITPVANLAPVPIAGTVVKRASLHNADFIQNLGLHVSDTVFVEKGGEIIPKITGIDLSKRHPMAQPLRFIEKCPECGSSLVRPEGEVAWYCPNDTGCPPQIKGKIEHFVSRKALDIDGLGQETIDLLFNQGLIKDVADIYQLQKNQLAKLDRMGDKSAQRILDGIENSKNAPFERVLFALGIRYVGETVAKKLAADAHSINNLQSKSKDELMKIDEIGERIAESIIDYFSKPEHNELINKLKTNGLQFETDHEAFISKTDKLKGLTIVISGTFEKHSRDELKLLIEQNGGKNATSISKKTSCLLAGSQVGPSKLEKAETLGIPVISETDLIKWIEGETK
jgi:DNA ligase (NAD+)